MTLEKHNVGSTPIQKTPHTIQKNNAQAKVRIMGLHCYTDTKTINDSLKEYGFTVTCTSMMKSRKTGNSMPLCILYYHALNLKKFIKYARYITYLLKLKHSIVINR